MSCPLEPVLARAVERHVFRLGGSDLSFWMRNPFEGFNGSSSTGSILGATAQPRNRRALGLIDAEIPCPSAIQQLGCARQRLVVPEKGRLAVTARVPAPRLQEQCVAALWIACVR